ncbi:MAG: type 4a pilus biogenesis protein PilO [Isosphaeraceae bacterium]
MGGDVVKAGAGGQLASMLAALPTRPLQFRVVLAAVFLGGWYFLAFRPLTTGIDENLEKLVLEKKRTQAAREIDALRGQLEQVKARLPETTDHHAWREEVMNGLRRQAVRLLSFEPRSDVAVGPYTAATATLRVVGTYRDVDQFLQWLEGRPRLTRITQLSFTTRKATPESPGEDLLELQVTFMEILG